VNIVKVGWLWLIGVLALFAYSFTQIDLGLTLTRASWWQEVQIAFQQIGYFQRPLSTALFLLIVLLLFGGYGLVLKNRRWLWPLIFLTAAILWLSYNAFSYDLFNYIMDAKMITFYHQNPYQHKALDFSGDPMLGFMHWTHRTYPYGPVWLVISVLISFLGFGKLLPTMMLFKTLAVGSYLLACWLVAKIAFSKKALVFFAFSPLVIIETLVSGHHDLLMMALALAGFWFLKQKKVWLAWLILLLSIGIKFATGLLVPVFLLIMIRQRQGKKIDWEQVWWASLILMVIAFLGAVYRAGHIMPWYLLYPLPFVALLAKKWLFWLTGIFSLGLLLHYAPFLYLGHWNSPVPQIHNYLTFGSLAFGAIAASLTFGKQKI